MAVEGTLWLAKRYPSTLISVFLIGIRQFSYGVATQLSSRGWVVPVPDPTGLLPETFLGDSRESNPGPLEQQSDTLTTVPNRWSNNNNNNNNNNKYNNNELTKHSTLPEHAFKVISGITTLYSQTFIH